MKNISQMCERGNVGTLAVPGPPADPVRQD